jgi:broad specificity phosphatase PhoE
VGFTHSLVLVEIIISGIMKPMEARYLWLVRHGQSQGNLEGKVQGHFDAPLTELGAQQARETGTYFADKPIARTYSSDLMRASRTAELILQGRGLDIRKRPDLREASFGEWEGMSIDRIAADYPAEYAKWQLDKRWRPEWCEDYEALQDRSRHALQEITEECQTGNLLIVTHGGFIFSLLDGLDQPPSDSLANCSISTLVQTPQGLEVQTIGEVYEGVTVSRTPHAV